MLAPYSTIWNRWKWLKSFEINRQSCSFIFGCRQHHRLRSFPLEIEVNAWFGFLPFDLINFQPHKRLQFNPPRLAIFISQLMRLPWLCHFSAFPVAFLFVHLTACWISYFNFQRCPPSLAAILVHRAQQQVSQILITCWLLQISNPSFFFLFYRYFTELIEILIYFFKKFLFSIHVAAVSPSFKWEKCWCLKPQLDHICGGRLGGVEGGGRGGGRGGGKLRLNWG